METPCGREGHQSQPDVSHVLTKCVYCLQRISIAQFAFVQVCLNSMVPMARLLGGCT